MEMLEWIPVEQAGQIETVCELAREIWTDRYLGAYGSMELDYLLRTWQSPGAVCRQIDGGHMEYRLDSQTVGGAVIGIAAVLSTVRSGMPPSGKRRTPSGCTMPISAGNITGTAR